MLLVIDGLDKLEEVKDLEWLPSTFTTNIKIILSATTNTEPYDILVDTRNCPVVDLRPLTGDQKAAVRLLTPLLDTPPNVFKLPADSRARPQFLWHHSTAMSFPFLAQSLLLTSVLDINQIWS